METNLRKKEGKNYIFISKKKKKSEANTNELSFPRRAVSSNPNLYKNSSVYNVV